MPPQCQRRLVIWLELNGPRNVAVGLANVAISSFKFCLAHLNQQIRICRVDLECMVENVECFLSFVRAEELIGFCLDVNFVSLALSVKPIILKC